MAKYNVYKLWISLLAMTFGFVIVLVSLIGTVNESHFTLGMTLGTNLVSAPLWYIIGNGVAAKSGTPVEPIVGKQSHTRKDGINNG